VQRNNVIAKELKFYNRILVF